MSWYRSTLNNDQVSAGEADARKETSAAAFTAARAPGVMAHLPDAAR